MDLRSPARLAWASLIVAWFFDFLFWNKAPGLSFFIFISLLYLALLLIAWGEGRPPHRASLLLLIPGLLFAALTFLRAEPLTVFVSACLAILCQGLFAATFLAGNWYHYSLTDYVVQGVHLIGASLALPLAAWNAHRRQAHLAAAADAGPELPTAETPARLARRAQRTQAASVTRGIFLALPVLAVLTVLLASADPIFGGWVSSFFGMFRLERFGEIAFRAFYVLVFAYLIAGTLLHALTRSRETHLIGVEKPWLTPFLGWTETAILLGSVDLLFAVFVAVQFRYFFGGQANINLAGYTYAEYARRGFFELVAVAVISLLLYLGLSSAARRATPRQARAFQGLVLALVGLVVVILVSAWDRLQLYETVYGFSRLRLYTHIFIPWLGLLLAGAAGLEFLRRPRAFALLAVAVATAFGASLALFNVDGWIARQNLARAVQGGDLDIPYLVSLSDDTVPPLIDAFTNPALPARVHDQTGAALACRLDARVHSGQSDPAWQSYRLPILRAAALFSTYRFQLAAYPVTAVSNDPVYQVTVGGKQPPCGYTAQMD
jgi:hypothetical protein